MAGLPASRAWLPVEPPLFWRGPSRGLLLTRSPGPVSPQPLPLSRSWLDDVTGALQFPPELPATMVFLRVVVPADWKRPPPVTAAFEARVTFVRITAAA